MEHVRVRFAPSPTGELHIGGARTALFNWLFAKKQQGSLVLRIDDTDQERSSQEHLDSIFNSLKWLGLDWNEGPGQGGDYGPYVQSERLNLYKDAVQKLLDEGKAYYCFCSTEELEKQKEKIREKGEAPRYTGTCRNLSSSQIEAKKSSCQGHVIRLLTPEEGETVVEDVVRGWVTFDNSTLDDMIIIKSDGKPTYNFASVVDDSLMNITHVIRAEEHLSNTPRQQVIAELLGYQTPLYAHVPMILAPDHSKLSKRHGATSVQEYKEMGILPTALLNYLALLGWSPGEDREIVPLEEMIQLFSLEKVSKNPAIYDQTKLTWMNGYYLRNMDLDQLAQEALPFFKEAGFVAEHVSPDELVYLKSVLSLVRERVKMLSEVVDATYYFFNEDYPYDEKGAKKHFQKDKGAGQVLLKVSKALEALDTVNEGSIKDALQGVAEELELSQGKINLPTRLALTGKTGGPELVDIIQLLGKEACVQRINKTIDYFELV